MKNKAIEQVKNAIREPYVWPGGYATYTMLADGALLCPQCARENFRLIVSATKGGLCNGWAATGAVILWEGAEGCAHCGESLQSAYGEDAEGG